MIRFKTATGLTAAVFSALLVAALAYAAGQQTVRAQDGTVAPAPVMVAAGTPMPPPPFLPTELAPADPAALSSSLSYYFISGNTFTTHGGVGYTRQVIGCVNQNPVGLVLSAPVHLPQSSQVLTITLYTYDSVLTTTTSTAHLIVNDGKGNGGWVRSVDSRPNLTGYQQNASTQTGPVFIDNQNENYLVEWYKAWYGLPDSPYLSLCGVRIAYYAPLGVAAYLPGIRR